MVCSENKRQNTRLDENRQGTHNPELSLNHTPVICICGLPRTRDSRDKAGLKCQDLTSDESRLCRGVGLLISRQNTLPHSFKLEIRCLNCLFNIILLTFMVLILKIYMYNYMQKFKTLSLIFALEQPFVVVPHCCQSSPGSRDF